jgi:hypothetical protein
MPKSPYIVAISANIQKINIDKIIDMKNVDSGFFLYLKEQMLREFSGGLMNLGIWEEVALPNGEKKVSFTDCFNMVDAKVLL